jgi:hypothetical protein
MLGNAHVVTHIDPCEIECPGPHECDRVKGMIAGLHSPERTEGNGFLSAHLINTAT